jgi:hypothetical protein
MLIGSFKVSVSDLRPFYVSLVSDSEPRRQNVQVFVVEKRNGSPMHGTSRHLGIHVRREPYSYPRALPKRTRVLACSSRGSAHSRSETTLGEEQPRGRV